jgi:starch synthase
MKIFVVGTRGIPNIPGGVEKHCQELFPRIVSRGHEVILARRSPYVKDKLRVWNGVKLEDCYSPHSRFLEAIVHTFIAILVARRFSPDIVHIQAIGPSMLAPLARAIGFKVVVTNHGPDYDRKKWGKLAKVVLRISEKLGGVYANEIIVISSVISDIVKKSCNRESSIIYNGVSPPIISKNDDFIRNLKLEPRRYILAVSRLVEEKGLHDLIVAFERMQIDTKLVIVGDADHESEYSLSLRKRAAVNPNIVMTGYLTGESLNQLYSHAGLFVLPSYHEGLPIALLEALSYGLPVLVSDIPANREINIPNERYFGCGDTETLRNKIIEFVDKDWNSDEKKHIKRTLSTIYDWNNIAEQTVSVYRNAIGRSAG